MGQVYNITKELNVDSLNLIESHLNFKNVFFNGDDAISKSLGLYYRNFYIEYYLLDV